MLSMSTSQTYFPMLMNIALPIWLTKSSSIVCKKRFRKKERLLTIIQMMSRLIVCRAQVVLRAPTMMRIKINLKLWVQKETP
jgi:hypothetical protein